MLPNPLPGALAAKRFVVEHLGHLICDVDEAEPSPTFRGGQVAADSALAAFEVAGYQKHVDKSYPHKLRTVSALSPWVRHGLLPLPKLWARFDNEASSDAAAFRQSLLWQEFARHRYASADVGRRALPPEQDRRAEDKKVISPDDAPWDDQMGCIEAVVDELTEDGWLVGETRRWFASHWSVRHQLPWVDGEAYFFRHLLDGSRAANRLGWELATGRLEPEPLRFSRWEVERNAPGLCASCDLAHDCPIEQRPDVVSPPDEGSADGVDQTKGATADLDVETWGPVETALTGTPEAVWITAESLGDADPALAANPSLPAIFVFDEPLLRGLQLSGKRLMFLVETLAELAVRREVKLMLGRPTELLEPFGLAATFTPVPGWRKKRPDNIVETHPWPWLVKPSQRVGDSFERWRVQSMERL